MSNFLLTGAGFSRNWGGWLAEEAFEFLLGEVEHDDDLCKYLWKSRDEGLGFEAALAQLQMRITQALRRPAADFVYVAEW